MRPGRLCPHGPPAKGFRPFRGNRKAKAAVSIPPDAGDPHMLIIDDFCTSGGKSKFAIIDCGDFDAFHAGIHRPKRSARQ